MKNTKQPNKKPKLSSYWIYGLIILFFASTYFVGGDSTTTASKNINISSFERFLNKGEIKAEDNMPPGVTHSYQLTAKSLAKMKVYEDVVYATASNLSNPF